MRDHYNPGHLLGKTLRSHHHMMRNRFDDMGLHRGQPPLIMQLYKHDGMTHSDLAERLEVTPATVSNMVKRMERDGLVIRRRDDEDERISRVFLTEAGKALREKIVEHLKDIETGTFAGFSKEEMDIFNNYMERIISNLKKMC